MVVVGGGGFGGGGGCGDGGGGVSVPEARVVRVQGPFPGIVSGYVSERADTRYKIQEVYSPSVTITFGIYFGVKSSFFVVDIFSQKNRHHRSHHHHHHHIL